MAQKTSIEWTEASWNPVRGCSRVSEGCRNCYAERMAARFSKEGQPYHGLALNVLDNKGGWEPRWTGEVRFVEEELNKPIRWRKPKMVFVNSMSDLYHESIELDIIQKIFYVMATADRHTFQILTKRSSRLRELNNELSWAPNIWQGVSVENEKVLHRIDDLRETSAHVKWLSLEPLLGPLNGLDLDGIDWVVVGGESGYNYREMDEQWALDIRDKCIDSGVPFFFKQYSGFNPKKKGRLLQGKEWSQYPNMELEPEPEEVTRFTMIEA